MNNSVRGENLKKILINVCMMKSTNRWQIDSDDYHVYIRVIKL